jgi:hypothetical protein
VPLSTILAKRSQSILRALGLGIVVFLFFFCNQIRFPVLDYLAKEVLSPWLPRGVPEQQLLTYIFIVSTAWLVSVNVVLSLLLIYLLSLDWKYTRLAGMLFAVLVLVTIVLYIFKRLWFSAPGTYLSDLIYFLQALLETPMLAVLLGVSYHMRKSGNEL